METVVRSCPLPPDLDARSELLLHREWLVTNGLGGYASGTIARCPTRRYHGLLVAALPIPLGRTMMLNHLEEQVRVADGPWTLLGTEDCERGRAPLSGLEHLLEFRLEDLLPVWVHEVSGAVIERRVHMPHMQNTVHVTWTLLTPETPAVLRVRPFVHFRSHDLPVNEPVLEPYTIVIREHRVEVQDDSSRPPLRLRMFAEETSFTLQPGRSKDFHFRIEAERGYPARASLWSPGGYVVPLRPGQPVTLVASTEPWTIVEAIEPEEARHAEQRRRRKVVAAAHPSLREPPAAELVLAADQFVVAPNGRIEDAARARATGDELRTVIAGYHWFTDWGRDTMISLEGLTLHTGREQEGGWILRAFGRAIRNGLIPNFFPEGEREGVYHTADATLWYFHAVHRYHQLTRDRSTLRHLLPKLIEVAEHHLRGTSFGIVADPEDGLLHEGAEGYALTWMDAKVEDWVVTPRRGKPVEINALWYNALELLARWCHEEGLEGARRWEQLAEQARASFNRRFWNEERGCLFDVLDGENGDDPAVRPNQLFAISLDHPVLERGRWEPVLRVIERELLTPVGLRTLARAEAPYKPRYFGDRRSRDAAYHQGTVWPWLLGPFVDAWLRTWPDDVATARRVVESLLQHMDDACVGTISEVFDAEAPWLPRACVAQAWSVAEALRTWVAVADARGG